MSRPPLLCQEGWRTRLIHTCIHPPTRAPSCVLQQPQESLRRLQRLRVFFLMAQPPLLIRRGIASLAKSRQRHEEGGSNSRSANFTKHSTSSFSKEVK